MESGAEPLKIYIIPFLAPSHTIPIVEIGLLLASRGQDVTVLTTHSNTTFIQPILAKHDAVSPDNPISIHSIKFPAEQVGLPVGVENFMDVNDVESAAKVYRGMMLLQQEMESFINEHPPDCLFADPFFPWTVQTANRLQIPRIAYLLTCAFTTVLMEIFSRQDSPHHALKSDDEPFVVPGLPHPITFTRAQLPDYVRNPDAYAQLLAAQVEADRQSFGVVVNCFEEMDPQYSELYRDLMGHRIYHAGPTCLLFRSKQDHECLHWLDTKKPNSVIYLCFGSSVVWPERQLTEIAYALDSAGYAFLWVLTPKNFGGGGDRKWMPAGLEEKGFLVKGWVPQVAILEHPAVGVFVTHCGWSSTLEGVSTGVPMVTWPVTADQFYQEKLVTQMLKTGVEAGSDEWFKFGEEDTRKLVKRERIEEALRAVMEGGAAAEMRKNAGELREKALKAAGDGGSSQRSMTALIEDLMQEKERRRCGE